MANTIDSALVDRMYAMGLRALRKKTSILRYVTRKDDEVNVPGFKGQSVIIPIVADMDDAEDVVPSNTPPAGQDIELEYAEVNLNNWKKTSFHLTDLEVSRLQDGTMTDQFTKAIDKLAKAVVESVWANHTSAYSAVGTAGTTPFATNTVDAQQARRILNTNGCPVEDRAMVLDFDADANAIGLPQFQAFYASNTEQTLREGIIGRALGFDWDSDGYMPSFTGGTLSNGTGKLALINNASVAVGDTTVNIDETTLTGTLVVGDIFTVAGDTQQYVVTANATASGNAITGLAFSPPAKVAWADNAVVTFVGDYQLAGAGFHRQALAFCSKPLDDVAYEGGSLIRTIPDPVSGLVMTLEITRQYKRTNAEFSMLWGSTMSRKDCFVKVLG